MLAMPRNLIFSHGSGAPVPGSTGREPRPSHQNQQWTVQLCNTAQTVLKTVEIRKNRVQKTARGTQVKLINEVDTTRSRRDQRRGFSEPRVAGRGGAPRQAQGQCCPQDERGMPMRVVLSCTRCSAVRIRSNAPGSHIPKASARLAAFSGMLKHCSRKSLRARTTSLGSSGTPSLGWLRTACPTCSC